MSHSPSNPTIEEIEDEDIHSRGNVPPRNPQHIIELTDEEGSRNKNSVSRSKPQHNQHLNEVEDDDDDLPHPPKKKNSLEDR